MTNVRLMPVTGMNTVKEDAALYAGGDDTKLQVRDAVNLDITPAGKVALRPAVDKVSDIPYGNLWQSPLHGDVFATFAGNWVHVDPLTWSAQTLSTIGTGDVSHEILNNLVCVAGPAGIYTYNGMVAQRLVIETPSAPLVTTGNGSLSSGAYGVAIAWMRGAMVSATSEMKTVQVEANGSLSVTFPLCLDSTITHVRLYLTKPNGGELARAEDYAISTITVDITLLPALGAKAQFQYMSPMPTGQYLKYWRGRLLTVRGNVLRFSEALAYHIHDERHGFVQMPQRITFVLPVDGGIWVGQVDHVAFLAGETPDNLNMQRKAAHAPVPGSAILVDAATLGGELSQGGSGSALWLSDNGYVVGSASGQTIELHGGVMSGITANSGTSVVIGERVMTVVV